MCSIWQNSQKLKMKFFFGKKKQALQWDSTYMKRFRLNMRIWMYVFHVQSLQQFGNRNNSQYY